MITNCVCVRVRVWFACKPCPQDHMPLCCFHCVASYTKTCNSTQRPQAHWPPLVLAVSVKASVGAIMMVLFGQFSFSLAEHTPPHAHYPDPGQWESCLRETVWTLIIPKPTLFGLGLRILFSGTGTLGYAVAHVTNL